MRWTLLFLGFWFSTTVLVHAQEQLEPPSDIPQWVVLTAGDGGDNVVMSFPSGERFKTQAYTVHVPYQEVNEDGKVVQRMKSETRLRQVRIPAGQKAPPKKIRWRSKDLHFLDLDGKPLAFDAISKRIAKPTAAMLVHQLRLDPFFKHVLKPETIVVVIPNKKNARK